MFLEPGNLQYQQSHGLVCGLAIVEIDTNEMIHMSSYKWQKSLFVFFGGPEKGRLVRVRWADESA